MNDKKEFLVGDKVTYVPRHAKGDASHPDCEEGIVTSMNDKFVFVEYGTGTAKGTDRDFLVLG